VVCPVPGGYHLRLVPLTLRWPPETAFNYKSFSLDSLIIEVSMNS